MGRMYLGVGAVRPQSMYSASRWTKKASLKAQKTDASDSDFMAAVENDTRREDAVAIDRMLREITGDELAMWGPSIIGCGDFTLVNSMGAAQWPKIGFSPRKNSTVLYLVPELLESDPLMKKLGKHKIGKSCLHINRLSDVGMDVLRELATRS